MTVSEFNLEYDRLSEPLRHFALRLTRDSEDAKDLVQETVCRAYWNRARFTMGTNFKAWLLTIMRNTYISAYRKRSRSIVDLYGEEAAVDRRAIRTAASTAESNLSLQELQGLLASLDSLYSLPFTLFYTGYRYDEIAQQLGLPIGTVKSRIFSARQRLRKAIREQNLA